jgi:hypothetical protein
MSLPAFISQLIADDRASVPEPVSPAERGETSVIGSHEHYVLMYIESGG